jgi:competence protein ComEC
MKSWIQFAFVALALGGATAARSQSTGQLTVVQRSTPAASNLPPVGPGHPEWMAAHFINVGQGASTLLEFSCGLVLIDTGGGEAQTGDWVGRFTAYLDRVFQRRPDLNRTIDVVFLTHPHSDHTNGSPSLVEGDRYRIRQIFTNAQTRGSGIRQQNQFIKEARRRNIPVEAMAISKLPGKTGAHSALTNSTIDPLQCNGSAPDISLLWGSSDKPPRWTPVSAGNNHSLAIRVVFGESSFLIIGDLEDVAQRAMLREHAADLSVFNVDVYEAGHHGSRNGTTPELVDAMTPEIAVIEAGNPASREPGFSAFNFGHPNRKAITMLTDPPNGVSLRRPTRTVAVGISGIDRRSQPPRQPVFVTEPISHAIFATGWDGNVVIFAKFDGEKRALID